MYSTCLFCTKPLGANAVVEHFPVGRRLAFDGARGRLWVVCTRCGRWNLTPVEERWEAIEECERHFRSTRMRASTDNIGLARLAEGLELVRVGEPLRPEFAAWRYGDQFGRRRLRASLLRTGAVLGAAGAIAAAGVGAGLAALGATYGLYAWRRRAVHGGPGDVVATIPGDGGRALHVRRIDLERAALATEGGDAWRLDIAYEHGVRSLTGTPALRAVGTLLAAVNRAGADPRAVRAAVQALEAAGGPERFFVHAARHASERPRLFLNMFSGLPVLGALNLTAPELLALEMAANEETERRALEGELAELERAWREAEEIAAIADGLT